MDLQRYCEGCFRWFDIGCIEEVEGTRRTHGPLSQQLGGLPIVRGWMTTPAANWMTVGSGRLVKKAKSLSKERGSHDWGNLLGEEFISFVTKGSSMLEMYVCPGCKKMI